MKITQAVKSRAAYFAAGRVTVGTVGIFHERTREFSTVHVGKLRGKIVSDDKGRWKFKSPAAARKAATWFLSHAKKTASA